MRKIVLPLVVLAVIAGLALLGFTLFGVLGMIVLGAMATGTGLCFGLACYFENGAGATLFGFLWGLCAFATALAAAVMLVVRLLL